MFVSLPKLIYWNVNPNVLIGDGTFGKSLGHKSVALLKFSALSEGSELASRLFPPWENSPSRASQKLAMLVSSYNSRSKKSISFVWKPFSLYCLVSSAWTDTDKYLLSHWPFRAFSGPSGKLEGGLSVPEDAPRQCWCEPRQSDPQLCTLDRLTLLPLWNSCWEITQGGKMRKYCWKVEEYEESAHRWVSSWSSFHQRIRWSFPHSDFFPFLVIGGKHTSVSNVHVPSVYIRQKPWNHRRSSLPPSPGLACRSAARCPGQDTGKSSLCLLLDDRSEAILSMTTFLSWHLEILGVCIMEFVWGFLPLL